MIQLRGHQNTLRKNRLIQENAMNNTWNIALYETQHSLLGGYGNTQAIV
jgi:hypothetical protein